MGVNPDGRSSKYRSPIWLWMLTLLALASVIFLQRPEPADPTDKSNALKGLDIQPPGPDAQVMMAKLILGMKALAPAGGANPANAAQASMFQGLADQLAGWVPSNPARGASVSNPPVKRTEPFPAVDRFRTAILAGESMGPPEIGWRLDDVEQDLAVESELRQDIDTIRRLYGVGKKPMHADELRDDSGAVHASLEPVKPSDLDSAAIEGLKKRHGLFAELALTKGDDRAPARAKASEQGLLLVLVMVFGVLGLFVVIFAGLVLLIVAMVNLRKMKPRFQVPSPDTEFPSGEVDSVGRERGPGSVWLETLCVFVLSFLAIKGIGWGLEQAVGQQSWLIFAAFGLQVMTALTIFWPMVRGMSFERWKRESGWAAPRGVLREVGAGIVGYVAMIPLYFGMALVVVALMYLISEVTGGEPPVPEGNRITEIMGGGNALVVIGLFLMATVWAPTVEETIFRGATYRHLRRRWAAPLAALGSAFVFAALHGYVLQGLLMVGTLGVMFAILREWRGSLIACVTAHAIHNAAVSTLLAVVFSLAAP